MHLTPTGMTAGLRTCAVLAVMGILAGPAAAVTTTLTGTVRDFMDTHPDFESVIITDPGIVAATLGADKKPVYTGLAGNPSTHGAVPFDQWYRDVGGVNTKTPLTITLDNTITADPAVFTYTNGSFFPIDGMLFGNEGRSHNYHFTYEIHSEFTYTGGEAFAFTGDDDLWVFINDKLAIDLGGVHGALSESVSLDAAAATLGLTTGETYDFDLFFAERHTTASTFRIDTSIALRQPPPPPPPSGVIPEPMTAATSLMALGMLGTFMRRRRSL